MNPDGTYLAVKNWHKYQKKLKNGRERRDWIAVQTRLEDDADFLRLNFYQRSVLQGLWRMRGATGRNIPDDTQHIRRFLAMSPQECSCLRAALELLKSYGWLIPHNQQTEVESATQDKIRQDRIIKPPKAPRKPKPFAGYTDDFLKVWEPFPKKKDKGAAFKAFQKAGINGNLQQVIDSIEDHKKNDPQWANPQYVPNLATWLNARGWEDELETNQYEFLND